MKKLIDELITDYKTESQDTEDKFSIEKLKYDISFFVKVSNNYKKWSAKDIMVAEDDQKEIIKKISALSEIYVEDFKTEDRDPEFLYKYNNAGLLVYSDMIQKYFADIAHKDPILHSNQTKEENPGTHVGLVIENYEENAYPPSDEMNLIVHRLKFRDSFLLIFCRQIRTSLAKKNLKTIINGKLTNIEKKGIYKITHDISYIMTPKNYYLNTVPYFERIFSFENQTKLKKQRALASLQQSNMILGYEKLEKEFSKGYMARSIAKISLNEKEIPKFIISNKEAISKYCNGYQVGLKFDSKTNKFIVIDEKIAPLFITYLFSERVAENILGELVYYKTFNKLDKNN